MIKITINTKLLLTTVILLVLTLGATDFVWYRLVQPILTDRLASAQTQLGKRAADKVDQFLLAKERILIVHSQSAAFLTQNRSLQKLELYTLFTHDQDIEKITLIDNAGKELMVITRDQELPQSALQDRKSSPAFVAATFHYGKEYISPVSFIEDKPIVTMAVPITVPNTSQRLTDLTTATKVSRTGGEILGVLEVTIQVSDLLHGITDLSSEETGLLYVVDNEGKVIAHQQSTVKPLTDLSALAPVKAYLASVTGGESQAPVNSPLLEYTNERNEVVLGTFAPITKTAWAVIVQQPKAQALAEFNKVSRFAFIIFALGIIVAIPVAFTFSRRLTKPIRELVNGAEIIGSGNFDYQLAIKSHDEVADLAIAFHNMAQRVKSSIAEIKAERNKLSLIIAGIHDGVIAVDRQRVIILVNTATEQMLGISSTVLLGQSLDQVMKLFDGTAQLGVQTYCPIRTDDYEGVVFYKKNARLLVGAKELFIDLVVGTISQGEGTNVGCILTIHDVTREVQLEEMKLDFVSMAAHELRTPLTAISGYLAVFIHENANKFSKEQASFLNRVSISAQRLHALIENLLNVSKIERNGLTISQKPTDWVAYVKQSLEDFQTQAQEKQITLTFIEPKSEIPQITIDPLRVGEVLGNIVSNALSYTPPHGSVAVNIDFQDGKVITHIKDTGQGIPESAIPHLFTKFFRVSGSLEQGSKGTGLGLYISKAIITMHQGEIWVESKPGQGSTFSFSLPIKQQAVSTQLDSNGAYKTDDQQTTA